MWMMVLCCGAPILLLIVISLLGANFAGLKIALSGALPFICPIMMLIMMPMMFMRNKNSGECHENKPTEQTDLENDSNGKYLN
jgi:hypothetical protein